MKNLIFISWIILIIAKFQATVLAYDLNEFKDKLVKFFCEEYLVPTNGVFIKVNKDFTIKSIKLLATKAKIRDLNICDVYLKANDVKINIEKFLKNKKFKILSVATKEFRFKLTQEAVNDVLKRKAKKLKVKNGYVEFKNNCIVFRGETNFLKFTTSFYIRGRIKVKDKHLLNFEPRFVIINGSRVSRRFLKKLAKWYNPLVDLEKLPIPIRVEKFEIVKGEIRVEGK